jgi:hypothetical protein
MYILPIKQKNKNKKATALLQTLGATVQNIVPRATKQLGFVNLCLIAEVWSVCQ